jgi:hypothetical protein
LPVFVIEHFCRAESATNTKRIKLSNDFKIVLRIKTYVSCRKHDYIIQIENRVLLEEGRGVIEGFVNEINNKLCVMPRARTLRIKK